MTDHRCPKCNRTVSGRQEVTPGKPRRPVTHCPHCRAAVRLTSQTDDLGLTYYYTLAPTATTGLIR